MRTHRVGVVIAVVIAINAWGLAGTLLVADGRVLDGIWVGDAPPGIAAYAIGALYGSTFGSAALWGSYAGLLRLRAWLVEPAPEPQMPPVSREWRLLLDEARREVEEMDSTEGV